MDCDVFRKRLDSLSRSHRFDSRWGLWLSVRPWRSEESGTQGFSRSRARRRGGPYSWTVPVNAKGISAGREESRRAIFLPEIRGDCLDRSGSDLNHCRWLRFEEKAAHFFV